MKSTQNSLYGAEKWSYWITTIAILAGLALSIIAVLHICSEECEATHDYRLFGFPIAYFGLLFFSVLIVLQILAKKWDALHPIIGLFLLGAIGAEVWLIAVQKYQIGHWCPVCLSILGTLLIALTSYLYSYFKIERQNQEVTMKKIKNRFIGMSVLALGFLTAFLGVTKINPMQAAENAIKNELYFGNSNSPITVYVFTDWECPACRAVEPALEQMASSITKQARLVFVDFVIHPETLNFIPYNLSFMIHNKQDYFKLRKALSKISEITGEPSEEQVEKAVEKLGATYHQLNYADVKFGINYFEELGKQYKINRTPTIAVVNRTTKKGIKLAGTDEITEEKVMKAITSMNN